MVCVEDKNFQCDAVTNSVIEEVVREICVSPAPDTSPSGDLSRQCGSATTPPSFVKCYVILFNEIYIYEMGGGGSRWGCLMVFCIKFTIPIYLDQGHQYRNVWFV